MAYVYLLASPDDYLLEGRVRETLESVSAELGGVEPELLREETTPEELAVELCSPSLFAPQRVLFAPDIRSWLDTSAGRGRGGRMKSTEATVDAESVVRVLSEGLVIDAWADSRRPLVARTEQLLSELKASGAPDLAMLAVTNRQLKSMVAS